MKNIKDHQYIKPSAFAEGSPIVYYSPAITSGNTLCSFHLIVDTFDDSTISAVGKVLGSAAGIPLFAPASAFLLVGASLLKMGAEIGKAFERSPYLEEDISLNFLTPGMPPIKAQAMIMTNNRHENEFNDYKIAVVGHQRRDKMMALVHKKTGRKYKGNAPYMIAVVDGRTRTELTDFAPRLATAALLDQFYPKGSVSSKIIETIENSLELSNDLHFRKKAKALQAKLATYPPDSKQYQNTKILLEAYLKNIRNELFKLKAETTVKENSPPVS